MRKRSRTDGPTKRVLKAIAAGLRDISDHYAWEDFITYDTDSPTNTIAPQPTAEALDEENDNYDDESYESKVYQREDVEVAVDLFLSQMLADKLITKREFGRPPSFADIFENFFGEHHPIVQKARSFDEHIKGYFDCIEFDDMKIAYDELLEIQADIEKELHEHENDGR